MPDLFPVRRRNPPRIFVGGEISLTLKHLQNQVVRVLRLNAVTGTFFAVHDTLESTLQDESGRLLQFLPAAVEFGVYIAGLPLATRLFLLSAEAGISQQYMFGRLVSKTAVASW